MEKVGKSGGLFGWYFNTNLVYRILIGLVLGAVAGLVLASSLGGSAELPKVLNVIRPFGQAFIRLLMMIMVPVIFATLVVGAASVSPQQLGKIGVRIMLIYVFTSFAAVGTGLLAGAIFRPQVALVAAETAAGDSRQAPALSQVLLDIIPTNIVSSVSNAQLLGIIFFTLCFGTALSILRASGNEKTKKAAELVFTFFEGIAEIMIKMVKGIMQYAPFGVFALIAVVFAESGPKVVGGLVMTVVTAYVAYLAFIIVWYLLVWVKLIGGVSIGRFVANAKEAFITGFVTRSSAATLPVMMECAQKLGIPKNVYSFAVPLGATINMDGTAIYQGVAVVFITLSVGHVLSPQDILMVLLMATLATIGTAGVPGGGAIMLLMVLTQLGLPASAGTTVAAAYAMILGIDALLDMCRTGINVVGDLVYLTGLSKRMGTLEMDKWK